MKTLTMIALILLIVGGLNWGLVGLFDLNLVAALFGVDSVLSNIVYVLVGLSALYCLYLFKPINAWYRHDHDTSRTAVHR